MCQTDIREILTKYKTVAVVGASRDSSKDSHRVAKYLKKNGFRIVPINPHADKILGEKSYKSLLKTPTKAQRVLEIVDIFRPSDDVVPIVEQVITLRKKHCNPQVVWMQIGIINEQAAELSVKAGLTVVMDRCIMQEHQRLFGRK